MDGYMQLSNVPVEASLFSIEFDVEKSLKHKLC